MDFEKPNLNSCLIQWRVFSEVPIVLNRSESGFEDDYIL
jgi:hypothetical protein